MTLGDLGAFSFDSAHSHDHYLTPSALRLLVEVAQSGGVGAAARAMGMTQPNASRTLAALERHIGTTLVERSPRGSRVTAAGNAVVEQAKKVLAAHDDMARILDTLASGDGEPPCLAASRTIGEHVVPVWLGKHAATYPGARVDFRCENSAVVIRWVRDGVVPIGFIEDPEPPEGLAAEVLSYDTLCVIAPRHHPWALRPVSLEELRRTSLVEREPGSGTRLTLDLVVSDRARPLAELDSNAAIVRAVAAGVGPAVLSQMAVARSVDDGAVARVVWDGPELKRPLHAIWREGVPVPRAAVRFLQTVRGMRAA